jgi:hypothetical protein
LSEFPGFVARKEVEDVNVSATHPLKEAALLVIGVTGGALVLFIIIVVLVESIAPLMPPGLEKAMFGGWVGGVEPAEGGDVMQGRCELILGRLLEHWPEAPYEFRIVIQPSDDINAFAVPGGTILVTTALMEAVGDDEELAFVLGHELGHFAHRDHLRGLGSGIAVGLISGGLGAGGVGKPVLQLINHVERLASRSVERQQEIAADAFGRALLLEVYGDSRGAMVFLERLDEVGQSNSRLLGYLRTHPGARERILALESVLEEGSSH